MQEIAEALRMQREALGLSIDDLFQRTRINPDYLRALEAGQFDVLPNTYARLFVKKFAQEVGLDDELILAQYDRHAPRPAPPPVAPPIHRQRNYQPLLFTAVGVFIVSLLVWQIRQQNEQETATLLSAPLSDTSPPPSFKQPDPIASQLPENSQTETPIVPFDYGVLDPLDAPVAGGLQTAPTDSENDIPEISEPAFDGVPVDEPGPLDLANSPDPSLASSVEDLPEPMDEDLAFQTPQNPDPGMVSDQIVEEPLSQTEQNQDPRIISAQMPEESTPETTLVAAQISERTAESNSRPEAPRAETISLPLPVAIAPDNPIILSGIAQRTTRLMVKADGRTLFDGELQAGSRPRWAARESLELLLSNRNDIALSLQNQPLLFDESTILAIQINIDRTQIRISPPDQ